VELIKYYLQTFSGVFESRGNSKRSKFNQMFNSRTQPQVHFQGPYGLSCLLTVYQALLVQIVWPKLLRQMRLRESGIIQSVLIYVHLPVTPVIYSNGVAVYSGLACVSIMLNFFFPIIQSSLQTVPFGDYSQWTTFQISAKVGYYRPRFV